MFVINLISIVTFDKGYNFDDENYTKLAGNRFESTITLLHSLYLV